MRPGAVQESVAQAGPEAPDATCENELCESKPETSVLRGESPCTLQRSFRCREAQCHRPSDRDQGPVHENLESSFLGQEGRADGVDDREDDDQQDD